MAKKTTSPPGVMLYSHFYDALKSLPLDTVGMLTLALLEYNIFGTTPEFDGTLAFAWTFIKNYADRDRKRYEETCEKRRLAASLRWARSLPFSCEDTEPIEEE